MTPERYERVRDLFVEAQTLVAAERADFLARECGADDGLRTEVESLLAHATDEPLFAPPPLPGADDPLGLLGAVLDDRYRLDQFVAEGGFGVVYRATHLKWNVPVAIKLFRPFLDASAQQSFVDAFIKEGALLNRLSRQTTAIVQSYDVGVWHSPTGAELPYTALEWLDGCSLSELMTREPGPWPIERVRAVLDPVAQALEVAHQNGIAHRDVKPANIVLMGDLKAPTVKLLDFGIAKVAAERAGGFTSTAGQPTPFSVSHAAPEQIARRHGPTGPWTDVYALALLHTRLLTGRHPYGEGSLAVQISRAQDPGWRRSPGALGVTIDAVVEQALARALSVDPTARPADAGAFRAALSGASTPTAELVMAPVEPRTRTDRRPLIRAALLVALVVGGLVAWRLLS
ncbi:MAG: serine/threonine protein kinase [Myxococcales bacterium]|nr:serine/threonine protein kinase [Myxococcales bacterium]